MIQASIQASRKTLKRALLNSKESFEYFLVYLSLRNRIKNKITKKVIFYPHLPRPRHILGRIFRILRYQISTTLDDIHQASFIVNWEDTTFRTYFPDLENLSSCGYQIININCHDISKRHVDEVFGRIFGYYTFIDPAQYEGICVQKGDINAVHDGKIITCPVEHAEAGYVYQKLINNQVNNQYVEDIRVPVFKNSIPFVFIKKRPLQDRFRSKNTSCVIEETSKVLNQQEIKNILTFCSDFGLDVGELDVLRDRNDGKIYIVDVNNTPGGPSGSLSKFDYFRALYLLTLAFLEQFGESTMLQQVPSLTSNKKEESQPKLEVISSKPLEGKA